LPKDEPVVLPPAGDLRKSSIVMGTDYSKRVYFSLLTENQLSVSTYNYDLAFENKSDGYRVQLNSAKGMQAWKTNTLPTLDQIKNLNPNLWKVDASDQNLDSTAIGDWRNSSSSSNTDTIYYVIDRGQGQHTNINERYIIIRLKEVSNNSYTISYRRFNEDNWYNYTIMKREKYSFSYFSFEENGKTVENAPPDNQWDIVFTRYTHVFEDQEFPFRNYNVVGVLANRQAGILLAKVSDSLPNYIPFEDMTANVAIQRQYSAKADLIGYDWKRFDFELGYRIVKNQYYLIKNNEGYIFKLRFFDFYGADGNKGTPQFEFKRL
jgi:hypothetical protein